MIPIGSPIGFGTTKALLSSEPGTSHMASFSRASYP